MSFRAFIEGGLASIVAGCSTHPFDLIKVRMQLSEGEADFLAVAAASTGKYGGGGGGGGGGGYGPIGIGIRLVQAEGFQALFCGVSATILRQSLYSTTRMGVYEVLKDQWVGSSCTAGARLPLCKKVAAAVIAGGVGAAVGNPADVAMVRMQADGLLPPSERRNYKSVVDALVQMVTNEGLGSLWTGSSLAIQRAMIVTACQLATYDHVKENLVLHAPLLRGNALALCFVASFSAGFVASLASNPIDVVKTRIMHMNSTSRGRSKPYNNALDCALKTIRAEGGLALYKGFLPTLTRQAPFTVVLFLTLERIRSLLKHL